MQVLHVQHQLKTAIPALPQTPLIEALAKRLGLLLDLLAWVPDFILNHFPLLQEDPDFTLSPWAIGRTCKDQTDGMRLYIKGHAHEHVNSSLGLLLHTDWPKMASLSYHVVMNTVLPALLQHLPRSSQQEVQTLEKQRCLQF